MAKPAVDRLDNSPNARKLLDSLRFLGYDNLYAITDIIDNAIDAEAQVVTVSIEKVDGEDYIIRIADDGVGMTAAVLDQASRLGSETTRSLASDLGRFGMGLVTASLSLGQTLTIISRSSDGALSNITDVQYMIRENAFAKSYFGPAREEEAGLFDRLVGKKKTGTVIQITNCDGFTAKYVKAFEKNLAKHIGQVYRWFIRSGRRFIVNGEVVEVNDPLWLDDPRTEVYSDEGHKIRYAGEEHPVQVRLVILPDHGSSSLNKAAGYNVQKSGFYVLRNQREIAEAELLGLPMPILSRHPDWIRFRGEVFIPGSLDEAFGIEFTKRDVKPTQSVRDQLIQALSGELASIRKRLKKEVTKEEGKDLDLSSSEQWIDSKSALLIKPRPKPEVPGQDEGLEKSGGDASGGKSTAATRLGIAKFKIGSFGKSGGIYEVEQQGKTIIIEWNSDHPFYERFLLENRKNADVLTAVNSLVFSMAAAELKVFDEDSQVYVQNWKEIVSSNLRTLLS